MINTVRNTVLAILNKDNRGYITPAIFNLYAKQAQLELFNGYMVDYNNEQFLLNNRKHSTGNGDLLRKVNEVIDYFTISTNLSYNFGGGVFDLPTDNYRLTRVNYNGFNLVEPVSHGKALSLVGSNLTAPTTMYPIYTISERTLMVYPSTITGNISATYIRYPKDPKWTWSTLVNGEPLFDQGANDYQDFELPTSDETRLIVKILQYCGISIREAEVAQAAKSDELQNKQEKL